MRAPFQVIIFPYRIKNNELQVLIGKRADDAYWQAISGGGEDSESPLEAARRELFEETGLDGSDWVQLESMCTLPKIHYQGYENWNDVNYTIPEFAFMACASGREVLSEEHSELRWAPTDKANLLLQYDSNKNALWEVSQRVHSQPGRPRLTKVGQISAAYLAFSPGVKRTL